MRMAGRSKNGLAKAIRTDDKGHLLPNLMGSEPYVKQKINAEVTKEAPVTLISEDSAIYIEHLVFVTNSRDLSLFIYKKDSSGNVTTIGDLYAVNGDTMPLKPVTLVSQNSSLFEVNQYDESKNIFKFTLRKPISFPQGFLIISNSSDTEPTLISVRVHGVKYND